ncbi:unnamed protein product [Lactuca saligna]|uniref:Uncharacterized protein n=1 Tax=Lactuca saligna TaxID=75948 RepID=A0AA35YZC6_LACSI|nr:unnamed protein product [Lactuca saligna]
MLFFAQLFLDQVIDCIFGNKTPTYVPYTCWLGLILSRKEGYVESPGIIIQIHCLSIRIINVTPLEVSKEDDEDNDKEDIDEDASEDDYEECVGIKKGVMKKKTLIKMKKN